MVKEALKNSGWNVEENMPVRTNTGDVTVDFTLSDNGKTYGYAMIVDKNSINTGLALKVQKILKEAKPKMFLLCTANREHYEFYYDQRYAGVVNTPPSPEYVLSL